MEFKRKSILLLVILSCTLCFEHMLNNDEIALFTSSSVDYFNINGRLFYAAKSTSIEIPTYAYGNSQYFSLEMFFYSESSDVKISVDYLTTLKKTFDYQLRTIEAIEGQSVLYKYQMKLIIPINYLNLNSNGRYVFYSENNGFLYFNRVRLRNYCHPSCLICDFNTDKCLKCLPGYNTSIVTLDSQLICSCDTDPCITTFLPYFKYYEEDCSQFVNIEYSFGYFFTRCENAVDIPQSVTFLLSNNFSNSPLVHFPTIDCPYNYYTNLTPGDFTCYSGALSYSINYSADPANVTIPFNQLSIGFIVNNVQDRNKFTILFRDEKLIAHDFPEKRYVLEVSARIDEWESIYIISWSLIRPGTITSVQLDITTSQIETYCKLIDETNISSGRICYFLAAFVDITTNEKIYTHFKEFIFNTVVELENNLEVVKYEIDYDYCRSLTDQSTFKSCIMSTSYIFTARSCQTSASPCVPITDAGRKYKRGDQVNIELSLLDKWTQTPIQDYSINVIAAKTKLFNNNNQEIDTDDRVVNLTYPYGRLNSLIVSFTLSAENLYLTSAGILSNKVKLFIYLNATKNRRMLEEEDFIELVSQKGELITFTVDPDDYEAFIKEKGITINSSNSSLENIIDPVNNSTELKSSNNILVPLLSSIAGVFLLVSVSLIVYFNCKSKSKGQENELKPISTQVDNYNEKRIEVVTDPFVETKNIKESNDAEGHIKSSSDRTLQN